MKFWIVEEGYWREDYCIAFISTSKEEAEKWYQENYDEWVCLKKPQEFDNEKYMGGLGENKEEEVNE